MSLILTPSDKTFAQDGLERWEPSDFGLDTLIVPYGGPYSKLTAFLNGLQKWSASSIDSQMFLSSYPSNGHKQWPVVELRYIGKRRGQYGTTARNTRGTSVQTATFNSETLTVDLTYLTPTSSYSIIAPAAGIGAAAGLNRGQIQPIALKTRVSQDSGGIAPTTPRAAMSFFTAILVTHRDDEELVPGRWWQNKVTNTLILI